MLGAWSYRALAALLCVTALPAQAQTVKVGAALSMTGAAAVYGASQKKGIELAAEEINKSGALKNIRLQVLVEDDGSTKEQVIPGAMKKAQQKLGFKSAAVLYGNDDVFTKAGYDVMKRSLEELKVKVMGTQTFAKADRDFTPQLTELKNLNPDIIVVSALADNASAIVSQARQLGYKGPIMGGNGFNSPAFIKNAGPAAEGVLVGTAWDSSSQAPENEKFIQAMQAKGDNPDQFAAQAYTAVYVLAEAIKRAGNKTGRGDIKAGLAKVKDLSTPLGKLSFTPERDGQHPPALQQVKDGKFGIIQ